MSLQVVDFAWQDGGFPVVDTDRVGRGRYVRVTVTCEVRQIHLYD